MTARRDSPERMVGRALHDKLRGYLLPYQWDWLTDRSRYKAGEKARRTGWTYVEALSAVVERLTADGGDYWFSSADETAALEFMEYCRFWADFLGRAREIVADDTILDPKTGARLFQLRFANGHRITALSSRPRAFRSKGGTACWDEAAWHDDPAAMWAALEPVTTWGGKLRVISTHNGEANWVEKHIFAVGRRIAAGQIDPAREGVLPWSHYRVTIIDAVEQGLVEKILGLTKRDDGARAQWLAEKRAAAGDAWDQEYMCVPSAESNVLLPWSVIDAHSRPAAELLGRYDGGLVYGGYDVGRERDLSVFTAGEAAGRVLHLRHFDSMAKTPYRVQVQAVRDYWRAHPIRRFCGDATGIGDMLVETLRDRYGRRVEKVKFTADVKEDLAVGLLSKLADHELWLPALPEIRQGLHKVRKTVTSAGNVRYDATRDAAGHADEFWSIALMVHAFAAARRTGRARSARHKPRGW